MGNGISMHTPGPWMVDPEDKTTIKSVMITQHKYVSTTRSLMIASVFTDDAGYKHNATLIAAAPELLLACVTALAALTELTKDQDIDWITIRNAINTARGIK